MVSLRGDDFFPNDIFSREIKGLKNEKRPSSSSRGGKNNNNSYNTILQVDKESQMASDNGNENSLVSYYLTPLALELPFYSHLYNNGDFIDNTRSTFLISAHQDPIETSSPHSTISTDIQIKGNGMSARYEILKDHFKEANFTSCCKKEDKWQCSQIIYHE